MKFNSTRNKSSTRTFEEAIFTGYMPDGGLLMPEKIPRVNKDTLDRWRRLSYVDLCYEILSLYISDSEVPREDLKGIIQNAYSTKRFPKEDICCLANITDTIYVLELFHGKTKAFKDIPLVLVAEFLQYFLERKKRHTTLLVGTSGDTGSAAIESVRGLSMIDIIVLFPKGYCNKIQELQMTTVLEDNVHVLECEGTSDDLDVPLKSCMIDKSLVAKYNIGSVNSINMGRILGQVVYYFYSYFKVCKTVGDLVKYVVPTGAMGNVTGGCIAQMMGLPIKLQCAVNNNNIVHRMIANGDFSVASSIISTWSTAMDIQVPYNMERVWYLMSNMDHNLVVSLMERFEKHQSVVNFPSHLMEKLHESISSDWVTKDETQQTMRDVWKTYHYLLCPHTAVGYTAATRNRNSGDPSNMITVVLATASPAKFREALEAAGINVPPPPEIARLATLPTRQGRMAKGEDWRKLVQDKIESIGLRC